MGLQRKLEILADAAKYDASCASSGAARKDSRGSKGVGSTGGSGICHSYAPDGRCISLLKVLLTNVCLYDRHYCINRRSSNVQRARFTPEEVVQLTLDFYKRNYIEGLFLSSGIIQSEDYTMELVIAVARKLREEHHFRGYIHLKTIPEASKLLPIKPPPLVREHRLYQADWLLRFYDLRDIHKMHAFVRFRMVGTDEATGREQFVAWFEPEYRIVRLAASFFQKRFTGMDWSILTPHECVHWDGQLLHFTPGVPRSAAPDEDALDDLWRSYYRSIFNPARLKVKMMQTEMPKKYWKNLPEASLIPELIAGSPQRVDRMLKTQERPAKPAPKNAYLDKLKRLNEEDSDPPSK